MIFFKMLASWILSHLLVICIVILGSGILFLLLLFGVWVYSIYYTVKHSPKGRMFFCPKHGMILPDHCIKFLDEPYCPYCFSEKKKQVMGV